MCHNVVIKSQRLESRVESNSTSRVRVESESFTVQVQSSHQLNLSQVESTAITLEFSHSVYSSHFESVEHTDLQLTYNTYFNYRLQFDYGLLKCCASFTKKVTTAISPIYETFYSFSRKQATRYLSKILI